ncbi:MAG: anti-sigma factor [Phycisphaerales bacterium]|nr:MAG: anti-sigma factor [Phycisphaerales bacterium]
MTAPMHHSDDRLLELLADRATEGLDPAQTAELERLLRQTAAYSGDELDRAAAALASVYCSAPGAPGAPSESMPDGVRAALEAQAKTWRTGEGAARAAGARTAATPVFGEPSRDPNVAGRIGAGAGLAWMAAAACLMLALLGWWPRIATTPPELPLDRIAALPDAVRIAWAPGPDETGAEVEGEVVWSNSAQSGYMTFRGLRPLDPSQNQYQLWIFDGSRELHPVDGGVFDIDPRTGEARVRIDAKLPVGQPTLFAITVEPPGGVVVSDQTRIAAVASPS